MSGEYLSADKSFIQSIVKVGVFGGEGVGGGVHFHLDRLVC